MDLFELLPQEDKEKMEKYIHLYGIGPSDFIGLKEYLKYWAESKKKLYRLLGNNFIVSRPFCYEKPLDIHEEEIRGFILGSFDFSSGAKNNFLSELSDYIAFNKNEQNKLNIIEEEFLTSYIWVADTLLKKITLPATEFRKELSLPAGMKPMRALGKVIQYLGKDNFPSFEQFRNEHSIVLNDKIIKGELVLSIHPFDFITMSDNASGWTSCMNWTEDGGGCYRAGTIEMMNSNNVICCYMKGSTPFTFDDKTTWNNKKWRELVYVTKEIIVGGKAYPYQQKELTLDILKNLRELAKENLNWTYTFGPELYKDMIHIGGNLSMNRHKAFIATGNTKKHNIIFDSKAMYNDMVNANIDYWCIRNKVKHNLVISYSGKAPCSCCSKDLLEEADPDENDYNNKYCRTDSVVCEKCYDEGVCYECGTFFGKNVLKYVDINGVIRGICPTCYEKYIKKCPSCNKPMVYRAHNTNDFPYAKLTSEQLFINDTCSTPLKELVENKKLIKLCVCDSCVNKGLASGLYQSKRTSCGTSGFGLWWRRELSISVTTESYSVDSDFVQSKLPENLVSYEES